MPLDYMIRTGMCGNGVETTGIVIIKERQQMEVYG